jgi:2-polyprenyl-6-hydroxyphenyl methylase/3-demethylubiquinone-9 3-methyltransferase
MSETQQGTIAGTNLSPGARVRRLFGPYEHTVAETYRRIFVDLDQFAARMQAWVPRAGKILEVGCGEGAMTERLVRAYPRAFVTAIDITPKTGRLFRGPRCSVTFRQETVEELAAREPAAYDLVVLADVIHHVPAAARDSLMQAIKQAMVPQGSLVFKDWIVSSSPIHWLCLMSDRHLTGDDVAYPTMEDLDALVTSIFGPGKIRQINSVPPWRNNVMLLVQP